MNRHIIVGVAFLLWSGAAAAETSNPEPKENQEITVAATELLGLAEICQASTDVVDAELSRLRQAKDIEEKRQSLERSALLFGQSAVGCPYLLRPRQTASH